MATTKKKNTVRNSFIFGLLFIIILSITVGTISFFNRQTALQPQQFSESFTPIYCNNYEFTCCNEVKDFETTATIKGDEAIKCPDTSNKCEVLSTSANEIWIGSDNCRAERSFKTLFFLRFVCDDGKPFKNFPVIMDAGQYGYTDDPRIDLTYNSFENKLSFCGRSGCTVGVPVQGADRCTFQTNKDIYDPSSGKILKKSDGTISYTVDTNSCALSYQQGDRYICGNFEEQCSQDSECTGHTYGRFECKARTLEEYGCNQLKSVVPEGVELVNGDYEFYETTQNRPDFGTIPASRCEIASARQVQCCGDADCGSNSFCDNNPESLTAWTCRQQNEVECTQNSDCGVSRQCNIESTELQDPVCNKNNRCVFETVKDVECCSDKQCSTGFFCSNENKCLEGGSAKTTCPSECCVNEDQYFDRPCKDGFSCSKDNVCIGKEQTCKPILEIGDVTILPNISKGCLGATSKILIIISVIAGIIVFFIMLGFTRRSSDNAGLNFFMSSIVGIGVGVLTYYLFWFGVLTAVILMIIWLLIPKPVKKFIEKGLET